MLLLVVLLESVNENQSPILILLSFFIGLIIISFAFPILLWNEGVHVHRLKSLSYVLSLLHLRGITTNSTKSTTPNDEECGIIKNNNKEYTRLAYVSDVLKSDESVLEDPIFRINVPGACRLKRTVEMYQKINRKHSPVNLPSHTVHDYVWSSEEPDYAALEDVDNITDTTRLVSDSQSFLLPFTSTIIESKQLKLGSYRLSSAHVRRINEWRSLRLNPTMITNIPTNTLQQARFQPTIERRNTLFFGSGTLDRPNLGDVRIRFSYVPTAIYTVIAKEYNDNFETFYTHNLGQYRLPWFCCFGFCLDTLGSHDHSIDFLWRGRYTPEEVILKESASNRSLILFMRLLGCSLMVLSIYVLMEPTVYFFGAYETYVALQNLGSFLTALCLGVVMTLFTVAIAWYDYNGVVSTSLIVLGVCLVMMLISVANQTQAQDTMIDM